VDANLPGLSSNVRVTNTEAAAIPSIEIRAGIFRD
jgi:hypothetical protein